MQHISPSSLAQLPDRLEYTSSFMGFTPSDGALIHATKPIVAPLLPTILDAVYEHLLSYDITASSFATAQPTTALSPSSTKQETTQNRTRDVDVHQLSLAHENIVHRKDFLRAYLVKLVSNEDWSPQSKFWDYIDKVGRIHTGVDRGSSRKAPLRVEYVHTALLLGWVADQVTGIVMGLEEEVVELDAKIRIVRAYNKFWWIQNDLFARHYVEDWSLPPSWTTSKLRNQFRQLPQHQQEVVVMHKMKAYASFGAIALAGIVTGATIASTLL